MTCIHIKQSLEKVNELISKMNDPDSSLYEKLGKYVSEDEADALLAQLRTSCTVKNIIRQDDLYNHLSVIFDILKSCECRNEIVEEYNQLVNKHNEDISTKLRIQSEVTNLRTRTEHYLSQLTDVRKMLEDKEREISRLENNFREKDNRIDNLLSKLAESKLDNSDKVGETKRKEDEIKLLKKTLFESQENFLSERLKNKKQKLEDFVIEIGIELIKAQNLSRRYKELILAQENKQGNDITIAQENIEATREGLLERGISNVKARKFLKKCKKIAQLEQQKEKIQEQFEARQEVPFEF